MLGLSASLLAGRTTGLPQLFPGPGQQSLVKQSLNLCSNTRFVLPLYWRQCNASIGCNARCLILDFKVLFQMDMISYSLTSQKIRPSNLMFNGQKENQYWVFLYLVIVISFGSCRNPFHIWFLFDWFFSFLISLISYSHSLHLYVSMEFIENSVRDGFFTYVSLGFLISVHS